MHRLLATINVLFAVSVLAWPLAVFFAIFLFDSPGSKKDPILLAFAASILAYLNRPEFSRHLQAVHYGNHGGVYERQAVFG